MQTVNYNMYKLCVYINKYIYIYLKYIHPLAKYTVFYCYYLKFSGGSDNYRSNGASWYLHKTDQTLLTHNTVSFVGPHEIPLIGFSNIRLYMVIYL